jgi:hypothetical protein
LKGTSHSFPHSAQTALCISLPAIFLFQLLLRVCAKIASCTAQLKQHNETYKTCHQQKTTLAGRDLQTKPMWTCSAEKNAAS